MMHGDPEARREALISGIVVASFCVSCLAVVVLAIAGALGVQLPAWIAAACAVGGFALGVALNSPRRP